MNQPQKNKRCSYKKITEEVRQQIIERILNNGQNIKDVAQSMRVNISTCKAIIKVYQEEGRIGKKKQRNKVLNVIETFSFYCINDCNIEQIQPMKIQESKLSLERNQNFDKLLQNNARTKAEKMLQDIIENKKKSQRTAAELQSQMMQIQLMQNNYMQCMANGYYPNFINVQVQDPMVVTSDSGSRQQQQPIVKEERNF